MPIRNFAGVVLVALAWFGVPLAFPPQSALLLLPPVACLVLVLFYGRKAIDFFYSGRIVVKPVISSRALVALSLFFVLSAALALAYNPRLHPSAFPPTNVIRCPLVLPLLCKFSFFSQRIRRQRAGFQLHVFVS